MIVTVPVVIVIRHHQSLCELSPRSSSTNNATPPANLADLPPAEPTVTNVANTTADPSVTVISSVANAAVNKRVVLLQTARALLLMRMEPNQLMSDFFLIMGAKDFT